MTVLFSHGSNETLNEIYPFLITISTILKCDVVSYDYSGYGKSSGIPTVEEIDNDLYQVAHFTNSVLKKEKSSLFLLGFSFGTTPTLYLASHHHYKKIGAVAIISPILEQDHIFYKNKMNDYIGDNIKKIKQINCPIYLIHGMEDEINNFEVSAEIIKEKQGNSCYLWAPKNGHHLDIFDKYRDKLLSKIKKFFEEITNKRIEKLNKLNEFNAKVKGRRLSYDSNLPKNKRLDFNLKNIKEIAFKNNDKIVNDDNIHFELVVKDEKEDE